MRCPRRNPAGGARLAGFGVRCARFSVICHDRTLKVDTEQLLELPESLVQNFENEIGVRLVNAHGR